MIPQRSLRVVILQVLGGSVIGADCCASCRSASPTKREYGSNRSSVELSLERAEIDRGARAAPLG
jgi:hypothetical protein